MKDYKIAGVLFVFVLISGCSKNEAVVEEKPPKLVFENMTIKQFKKLKEDTMVQVSYLESYENNEVVAGKEMYFKQYDTTKPKNKFNEYPVKLKGSVGTALLNQKSNEYFLGNSVFLELSEENVTISAPMLFFDKKNNLLKAPANEIVKVQRGYEMYLEGINFVANTLSYSFSFTEITGSASEKVNGEKENAK